MSEWYPHTSAPKSILTKSPAARTASVGRWCGIAELAPAATMVSNDGPSAPWSSINDSSSRPTSRSVRPGRRPPSATSSASAASAASQASRSSAISPASLISRNASTVPAARTSSVSHASFASASNPSTVTTWLSKPSRRTPSAAARPARIGPQARSMTISASGACWRGLRAVAPVGGQHRGLVVSANQQRSVGTGEPGQITHVDQACYQYRVQTVGLKSLPQTVPTLGYSHRP